MKKGMLAAVTVAAAAVVATAAFAGPSHQAAAPKVTPACRTAGLGIATILSGPAASLGLDQLHWARVFVSFWNSGKAIPGVAKGFKRTKIKFVGVGDSALDPQKAATVAAQMLSNKKVLAMVGFAGSNENLGGGPVLDRGGLVYVSPSATRDDLTQHLKDLYRVVPANIAQATIATSYMLTHGLVKSGEQAMVVDDAEAYGANQADDVQKLLTAAGLKVDRESQVESTGSATADFTALANKAVAIHARVVFAPTQVASDSQLFAQQLKTAGYTGLFAAADGSFDSTKFSFPGAFVSYYGADVTKVAVAKPYLASFKKLYGETLGFGPPTFTATEMLAIAVSKSCADGKTSRAEVRKLLPKVKITNSILGIPIAFNNKRDLLRSPTKGVSLFQIQPDGSYKLVASS
jgi:ABC-type branched-subunit amino acid transport system substrate-binding protein